MMLSFAFKKKNAVLKFAFNSRKPLSCVVRQFASHSTHWTFTWFPVCCLSMQQIDAHQAFPFFCFLFSSYKFLATGFTESKAIVGSRSAAGTGSRLCLCRGAFSGRRPRWTRCCRGRTRCSPFRWAWWRRSRSAASSPPPSKTGASRCGCTSRGSC